VEVASGRRWLYRELDAAAWRIARVWREALGLLPGDRVALLSENRAEYVAAYFAAGKAGAVLVPLSTRATPHELTQVLADCAPRVMFYSARHAATAAALREAGGVGSWVSLDAPDRSGDLALADLVASLPPSSWRRHPGGPEDLLALLYTSGTTGRPKGVMVPHRMAVWNAYNTVVNWQLQADDVAPIFTPLYHAGGLGAFLAPIVAIGGRLVLHDGFDAEEVWRTVAAERCTVILGVPTIWQLLLESPALAGADLSSVRWCISGGAPLPAHLIAAYRERGLVLRQGFGMTEVGVNCFAMTSEDALRKPGSIGQPMAFTEARLVDEAGIEVPVGEVGELLLRGAHVCRGYWQQPEATAAALDADGWFHTGDLARCDEDGFFTIAGRRKDMLISGGVNVYPAEIENVLLLHDEVRDAAVIGVPDRTWGEVAVAAVVLAPAARATADALAAWVGERLARYKVPRRFHFLDALPRTPYGKVVKAELRALLEGPPA
jgi:fatty-acyl-CoA synthase